VSIEAFDRIETMAERVSRLLIAAVHDGTIRQGVPVREEEWARRLGMSRTPVREAILQLVTAGVLRKDGRSVFLFQPSLTEIVEIYDMRLALEPLAARNALARADPEMIAGFAKRLEPIRIEGPNDQLSSVDHDAFHMYLYAASGQQRLTSLISSLRALSDPYVRFAVGIDPAFRKNSYRQHQAMVRAVAAGRPEELIQAIEAHLHATREKVKTLIDAGWASASIPQIGGLPNGLGPP
jgi:DNA-binding GntR family transcriptional regulator